MKKLVNFRLSLVLALCSVLGIAAFQLVTVGSYWLVAVCGLFAVGAVVLACFKKKLWLICLLAFVFCVVGFFNTYFRFCDRAEWDASVSDGVLTGRVTDVGRNGNRGNTLYLENCQMGERKLRGRGQVYVWEGENFDTGEILTIRGKLRKVYVFKPTPESFYVRDNVRYELEVSEITSVQEGDFTLAESVRFYVYGACSAFMQYESGLGYALLTGDRNAIPSEELDAFSDAGIIHLLVVSGLHVGFVVTVFAFLLKIFKLNPAVELAILLVPLVFYGYVCDFSPSIVRAIVMTVCLYVSRFFFGKYDLLTSLSWAVLFILTVQPLYLFDVGFQLSALSVFGIATLYLQLDRIFRRRKIPKWIAWLVNSLAMSFSCVAATFFVVAKVYGKVAVLGILVNVVAIPMVMVSFVLCVVGMLPWVLHYVLWLPDKILLVLSVIARLVQSLDATLPIVAITAAIVVSVALLFVLGGYVNLSKKVKGLTCGVLAAVLATCTLVAYLPKNLPNGCRVFVGYDESVVVAVDGQSATVVGKFCDRWTMGQGIGYLSGGKIQNVDLFVENFQDAEEEIVEEFAKRWKVSVYVLDTSANDGLERLLSQYSVEISRVFPNGTVFAGNASVQSLFDGGLVATVIKLGGISVCKVVDTEKVEPFVEIRKDVGYFVATDGQFAQKVAQPVLCLYQEDFSNCYGIKRYGKFFITQNKKGIVLSFRSN